MFGVSRHSAKSSGHESSAPDGSLSDSDAKTLTESRERRGIRRPARNLLPSPEKGKGKEGVVGEVVTTVIGRQARAGKKILYLPERSP